jgi:hypothetical protein
MTTLSDTHTLGWTPFDEGSALRRDVYLTTHIIHNRQTSMSPPRFESATPASEGPQIYVLEGPATGVGKCIILKHNLAVFKARGLILMRLNWEGSIRNMLYKPENHFSIWLKTGTEQANPSCHVRSQCTADTDVWPVVRQTVEDVNPLTFP